MRERNSIRSLHEDDVRTANPTSVPEEYHQRVLPCVDKKKLVLFRFAASRVLSVADHSDAHTPLQASRTSVKVLQQSSGQYHALPASYPMNHRRVPSMPAPDQG